MKRFLLVLLLLTGCASWIRTPLVVDGLVIQNATGVDIDDVTVMAMNTRQMVRCSAIPAGTSFRTLFPERTYQGGEIEIRWRQQGRPCRVGGLTLPAERHDQPVEAVAIIGRNATTLALRDH